MFGGYYSVYGFFHISFIKQNVKECKFRGEYVSLQSLASYELVFLDVYSYLRDSLALLEAQPSRAYLI